MTRSNKGFAQILELNQFDEIIDVRSPAEFAEDHIPGAVNCPVLDNAQRAEIGTLYVQVSPFEARKLGAAWVAENIARHLREHFIARPRSWRPLLYCWRGGQRSGSFTTWMRMIGWDACQLVGGYKTYRAAVLESLASQPARFQFQVLCGPTGSGKTRILQALAEAGAQALDLEALAAHRGSVLGALPEQEQPPQKWFETQLNHTLAGFDPRRPVFIEAESRRIGKIHLPESLFQTMHRSPCIVLDAARGARLELLLEDYAYLGQNPADLQSKLNRLKGLQSNAVLARWNDLAGQGQLATLFDELLTLHYDPLYQRSQERNYEHMDVTPPLQISRLDAEGVRDAAQRILAQATYAAIHCPQQG
ncbi:MAG: tRNA 2-selenouridine(34) synthase MnmH [Betaproteobacteria bacterium]|nr:tRNA 2-selenouridine(34) synthase MnmH [Betaproteobacteria bacterium]